MYGSRPRRRTLLTVALALLALTAFPGSSALAQSAGDEQYRDPLVTEGDDGGGERPAEPAPDGQTGAGEPPAPTPSGPAEGGDAPVAADAPAQAAPGDAFADDAATLPRTGADAWLLATLGTAALALGALGLALARDPRHARR